MANKNNSLRQPNEEDIEKIITFLNEKEYPYLLIGGQAMHLICSERATMDVDILIPYNRSLINDVINEFNLNGFCDSYNEISSNYDLYNDDVDNNEYSAIRIIDDFVIDIMFKAGGYSFEDLSQYKININYNGIDYKTIDERGLFLTKAKTYRDKDLFDLFFLKKKIAEKYNSYPDIINNEVVFLNISDNIKKPFNMIKEKLKRKFKL